MSDIKKNLNGVVEDADKNKWRYLAFIFQVPLFIALLVLVVSHYFLSCIISDVNANIISLSIFLFVLLALNYLLKMFPLKVTPSSSLTVLLAIVSAVIVLLSPGNPAIVAIIIFILTLLNGNSNRDRVYFHSTIKEQSVKTKELNAGLTELREQVQTLAERIDHLEKKR